MFSFNPYRIIFFLLLKLSSFAQGGEISGIIIDASSHVKLPYAKILIYSSGYGSSTITDNFGFFTLSELPEGEYKVEISFDGYKKKHLQNISVERGTIISLGVIPLQERLGFLHFLYWVFAFFLGFNDRYQIN